MTKAEHRILIAIEMGMRNHEVLLILLLFEIL